METSLRSGCSRRAKLNSDWTIRLQRNAALRMLSEYRWFFSSSVPHLRISEKPTTAVSGLFNSCATPATNLPMAESFSLWTSCACVVLSVTTVFSNCDRDCWMFSVIPLNTIASWPHSSRLRTGTRRSKSPRPTASAPCRSSRNGSVTRLMTNHTVARQNIMASKLMPISTCCVATIAASDCSRELNRM